METRKGLNLYYKRFQTTFNMPLSAFMSRIAYLGKFDFDIVGFDKKMHEKGYSEKNDGSLANYIRKTYGEQAEALIKEMIKA